ncbi:hypothetical protein ACOSQ4_027469 [Xanthoceras sorbifolium]
MQNPSMEAKDGANGQPGAEGSDQNYFTKPLNKSDFGCNRFALSKNDVTNHILPYNLTSSQLDTLRKGDEYVNIVVDDQTGRRYPMKLKQAGYQYHLAGTTHLVDDKKLQAKQKIDFSWSNGVLRIVD